MFKKYMEQIFVLLYAWPLNGSLFPFSLLFSLSTHMVNEPMNDWINTIEDNTIQLTNTGVVYGVLRTWYRQQSTRPPHVPTIGHRYK
jgi:hypothetical protein